MRYELTDHEWFAIQPLLPNKPRGVPRVDDRRTLNGIFWVLRSGAPWRARRLYSQEQKPIHGPIARRPEQQDSCDRRCQRHACSSRADNR